MAKRGLSVSNFSGDHLRQAAGALTSTPLTASQVSFHLFDQRWANDSLAVCRELGIGAMAYGPLAHGLLTGAFTREMTFRELDWRAAQTIFGQPLLTPGNFERNLEVVDRLKGVAEDRGITLPQLAIAWVLANPAVATTLVGARTPAEIESAVSASEIKLTKEDLARIEGIMSEAARMTTMLMEYEVNQGE